MTDAQGDNAGKRLAERIEQDPIARLVYRGVVLAFIGLVGWIYVTDRDDTAARIARLDRSESELQAAGGKQDVALALAAQNIETVGHALAAEHDRVDRVDGRVDALIERMQAIRIDITKLQDRDGGSGGR